MRWHVDTWDPAYGASAEADSGRDGAKDVELDVELPPESWHPLVAPADVRTPDAVLMVDGVRRIDATLWSTEDDGTSQPGLAASYAAGVVRCDLRAGTAAVTVSMVDRGLFTPSQSAMDAVAGQIRYRVERTKPMDLGQLAKFVQGPLTRLEVQVSERARPDADGDDLLVLDGPLRGRHHLPRTIGYVKRQQGSYLPESLKPVVTALEAGQRTPVFRGTAWGGAYSWYLRLPGPAGAPWAGIVRVECSPALTPQAAISLADVSLVTLPRFASTPYKDPRAPQNLIPIAGLERRLRALLGDPRLLHRALRTGVAAP